MKTDYLEAERKRCLAGQAAIEALRWRRPDIIARINAGAHASATSGNDGLCITTYGKVWGKLPLAERLAEVAEWSALLGCDPTKSTFESPDATGAYVDVRWDYTIPRSDIVVHVRYFAGAECPIKPRPIVQKIEPHEVEAGEVVTGYKIASECLAALEEV